jgi:hypothetical protein
MISKNKNIRDLYRGINGFESSLLAETAIEKFSHINCLKFWQN